MRAHAILMLATAWAMTTAMVSAAADQPGAMPGDDALSCDQIYAQGMAETQRDQAARQKDIAARKAQSQANAALLTGAMMAGGVGGLAAQEGTRAQTNDALAKAAAPQPANPRMDRLKALWAQKRCALSPARAADATPPADDAMTCEQIATELAPYANQMTPNLAALSGTNQQMMAHGNQTYDERMAVHSALGAMATAGALDPTGAANGGYVAAEAAQRAKERAEDEAFAQSDLAKQNRAQQETLAAQGKAMQSDGRVQHLMQLAQQKGCTRK